MLKIFGSGRTYLSAQLTIACAKYKTCRIAKRPTDHPMLIGGGVTLFHLWLAYEKERASPYQILS